MESIYNLPKSAAEFSKRQNNKSHQSITKIISATIKKIQSPTTTIINLGGRGNPHFFQTLFKDYQQVTWVTPSQVIQDIAEKNAKENSTKISTFTTSSATEFLQSQSNESIDIAFMKHNFPEVNDLNLFFSELHRTIRENGYFIANLSNLEKLKRHGSNGSFFIDGNLVPESGTKVSNGQNYSIRFFKEYQNPDSGYLDGELKFTHHNRESIKNAIVNNGLQIVYFGDFKEFIKVETKKEIRTDLLVVTKTS